LQSVQLWNFGRNFDPEPREYQEIAQCKERDETNIQY